MNIDIINRDLANTYVSLSIRYDVPSDQSAKTMVFTWWLHDNYGSELAARHADRVTRRIQHWHLARTLSRHITYIKHIDHGASS